MIAYNFPGWSQCLEKLLRCFATAGWLTEWHTASESLLQLSSKDF